MKKPPARIAAGDAGTPRTRGPRLVASAVVQILVVVGILVLATVLVGHNALETARTSERGERGFERCRQPRKRE